MTTVLEIEKAVRSLPEEEFGKFSSWFGRYEEERWDGQIERDQNSGALHDLMREAKNDFKAGKCNPLKAISQRLNTGLFITNCLLMSEM